MDTPGEIRQSLSRLPSALRNPAGWSEYFELQRSREPHVHQIEPTNHCPYTCVMCPRSSKMDRSLGFMAQPLFEKIIDEVAGYKNRAVREKEIELFHFGESLLHPQLPEMIGYASSRGLNITLSVNGPSLKPELSKKILKQNPYRIILSIDGVDNESYEKIRGKMADFDQAEENIGILLKYHQKLRSSTRITIRMIEMEINREQRLAFEKKWSGQGVEVEVREFFPWTEADLVHLGKVEKYPPQMPCPFPWRYVVVQWNGYIVPCCRDYNGVNVLGNVNEASLVDIWNGQAYADFRKMFAEQNWQSNRLCGGCMDIYFDDEK